MKDMRKIKIYVVGGVFTAVCLCLAVLAVLVWNGVILLNQTAARRYPVRGVDVSSWQGDIDWTALAAQDLSFAFVKATEGSSFVDSCFAYNYIEAQKAGLRVGAYHFFSFDSAGETQADHFMQTVQPYDGMLPPVVDIEFYGQYEQNPPAQAQVRTQLHVLLQKLTAYYGIRPVLYATEEAYALYISGGYTEYEIWIRNVVTTPNLPDGREWTFWQYTNRGRLEGYSGAEDYIDLNVFCGSKEAFARYAREMT